MRNYPSKTILIALMVIIIGLLFLIIIAGPNFSETDQEFLKSAREYQNATIQISKDIAAAYLDENYDGMNLAAQREKALTIHYRGEISGYGISIRLYPYEDELLGALDDENVSADYMILAANNFKQGQDAAGLAYFQMAEAKRRRQYSRLDQAARILEVAERPWWYYLRY
jgi:hypothetical protein